MTKIESSIRLVLLLSLAPLAGGQTAPPVKQTALRSPCANIVALSGAKVDCSNLTPAQKRALENIPSILKTPLENQGYLDAIMKKLDEMSKNSTAQLSVVCNDKANCGVSTGQTGGITAGQVVIAEESTIPLTLDYTQEPIASANPAVFPYALRVTIQPNRRIEEPSLGMRFDGPVEVPEHLGFSCMMCGTGRFRDANGVADLNTVWVHWSSPVFMPDSPVSFIIQSREKVSLVKVGIGPRSSF